jgi:hypothetical protein
LAHLALALHERVVAASHHGRSQPADLDAAAVQRVAATHGVAQALHEHRLLGAEVQLQRARADPLRIGRALRRLRLLQGPVVGQQRLALRAIRRTGAGLGAAHQGQGDEGGGRQRNTGSDHAIPFCTTKRPQARAGQYRKRSARAA